MLEESQIPATETQTPVTETVTPSTPAPAAGETSPSAPPADSAAPPAWTPDFKFKAAGADHEIPEMYRGLAKDQKTLEEVKRLHEKAYGVDSLVQSRDGLKNQLASLTPQLNEYQVVTKNFQRLSHFVENKDFDSFFKGLNIPEKDVIGWMQQKINLANASPEVQQQAEQNRRLQQEQYDQTQELNQYRAQVQQVEQAKAYDTVSSSVTSLAGDLAKVYDAKIGQEGAFIDYVINRGIQYTQQLGQEPPLEAVIQAVAQELNKLGLSTQPPTPAAPVPQPKPTLPVIPAGGQSPVKTPVRSMKELKERQKAMGL